ncbi:pyridoxal 5'-phosphate synthase glutaminase subunit PdxT [Candidatus Saccharibacteria bacterium]|jgi:5'-phosphate synthase pdxT subunit|nr:pyridoxal 5'-phosphate synthase glutaminase subunit PdxT [Candidatus Saccharibacteria bacterium]MBP9132094.1 pyridoxal 5'-phosphate synthase glutaminase subunit PdxT [Candidatus Saccharibacteria bacterium]
MPTIGVLALQGAFLEHIKMFNNVGVTTLEIRNLADLNGIDGLVIPGGESTTIGMQLKQAGMIQPIKQLIASGLPVWGTCAGMILLSDHVDNQKQDSQVLIGGLDINTVRNFYGRQNESFIGQIELLSDSTKQEAVFIRAPFIESCGGSVKVLAKLNTKNVSAVALRQENILVTAFHPELGNNNYWHQLFVGMIK